MWMFRSFSGADTIKAKSPLRRFLKLGSVGALGVTGFATCAYSLDEVAKKTDPFIDYAFAHNIFMDLSEGEPKAKSGSDLLEDQTKPSSTTALDAFLEHVRPFLSTVILVPAVFTHIYVNLRCTTEEFIQDYIAHVPDKLLPDPYPYKYVRPLTLVLDLTDTLVHSDWKDDIDIWMNKVAPSCKRPGLHTFLNRLSVAGYHLVLYTDEATRPVRDFVLSFEPEDKGFPYVLPRRATKYQDGKLYRDLSRLNRDPSRVLYVSAHALENCLQPENCLSIKAWNKEADDTTLTDLLPFLESLAHAKPKDVRPILSSFQGKDVVAQLKDRQSWFVDEHQRKLEEQQKLEERRMDWHMMEQRRKSKWMDVALLPPPDESSG